MAAWLHKTRREASSLTKWLNLNSLSRYSPFTSVINRFSFSCLRVTKIRSCLRLDMELVKQNWAIKSQCCWAGIYPDCDQKHIWEVEFLNLSFSKRARWKALQVVSELFFFFLNEVWHTIKCTFFKCKYDKFWHMHRPMKPSPQSREWTYITLRSFLMTPDLNYCLIT